MAYLTLRFEAVALTKSFVFPLVTAWMGRVTLKGRVALKTTTLGMGSITPGSLDRKSRITFQAKSRLQKEGTVKKIVTLWCERRVFFSCTFLGLAINQNFEFRIKLYLI